MVATSIKKKTKKLTKDVKWSIIGALGYFKNNGKVIRSGFTKVAARFGVTSRTVSSVFNEYEEKKDSEDEVVDLTPGFETREYITECTPEVEENLKSILVEANGEITYKILQMQYAEKFGRKFSDRGALQKFIKKST